jgi:hypothetical protein
MTSVANITRMIATGKSGAERRGAAPATDRVLGEAHKLFDELSDMLTELRRKLLGNGKR